MSEFRVRNETDFQILDTWFKRGMLGGLAKNMIKHIEKRLEDRWTVAEIKSYISAAKKTYQARGGIEAKVMQEAIEWMRFNQNPAVCNPGGNGKDRWFEWDTRMEYYRRRVNLINSLRAQATARTAGAQTVHVDDTIELDNDEDVDIASSLDLIDLTTIADDDSNDDNKDGVKVSDNGDSGDRGSDDDDVNEDSEDRGSGPRANARIQRPLVGQYQDNAVEQLAANVTSAAAAQPRLNEEKTSVERLQQIEQAHDNNQQALQTIARRGSLFKRSNEAAAAQPVSKKVRSENQPEVQSLRQDIEPAQGMESAHGIEPTEASRPSLAAKPAQGIERIHDIKPAEAVRPAQGIERTHGSKPAEAARPSLPPKPAQGIEHTHGIKSAEATRPALAAKPAQGIERIHDIKPAEAVRPALAPKPAQGIERIHDIKPAEAVRPALAPKPAQGIERTRGIKPAEAARPVLAAKPAQGIERTRGIKPAEAARPALPPKPAQGIERTRGIKPAEAARPALPPKPAQVERTHGIKPAVAPKPAQGMERTPGTNNPPASNTTFNKPQNSSIDNFRQKQSAQAPPQTTRGIHQLAPAKPTIKQEPATKQWSNTKILLKDLPTFKKSNTAPVAINPGLEAFAERRLAAFAERCGFDTPHTLNDNTNTNFHAKPTIQPQREDGWSNYRARSPMERNDGHGSDGRGNGGRGRGGHGGGGRGHGRGNFYRLDNNRQHPEKKHQAIPAQPMNQWHRERSRSPPRGPPRGPRGYYHH